MPWIGSRTAVAFDPSFIHKSGKKTPGIGSFWSGCAGRALRGIEILGLSVIDWYAVVIKKYIKQILSITKYVVADAYFSKKNFVEKILQCSLHLISKLRNDADLTYLSFIK